VFLAAALASCSSTKILVPPRYDLGGYGAIGLLRFSPPTEDALSAFATQQFMQQLQAAQPGVRILELGTEQEALASLGKTVLDAEAVRMLGERNRCDALVVGNLETREVAPSVSVSSLRSLSVSAQASAMVGAKLFDTRSGATLWSDSASGTREVGGVSVSHRSASFGADNPDDAYRALVSHLVYVVTDSFRAHWVEQ